MFNKSGVFGRNEPANPSNRRDLVSGSSTATSNASSGVVTPSATDRSSTRGVPTIKEAVPPVSAEPATPAVQPVSETVAASSDVMGARLIVGPEVKLKGAEILDCDTLVVEGRVEATMDSRVVRIAERGSFIGKVSIDIAEIHGSFEGDLTARSQLIIHATGRVKGTIRYGAMMVESGGVISGNIGLHNAPAQLTEEVAAPARDEKPDTEAATAEASSTSGKRSRFG